MASACGCSLPTVAGSACDSTVIINAPYSKHRYSSTWGNYEKGQGYGQGKLNSYYGWLPGSSRTGFENGEWLQIDTGSAQSIAGVVTQVSLRWDAFRILRSFAYVCCERKKWRVFKNETGVLL